jgi:hypothetical protein
MWRPETCEVWLHEMHVWRMCRAQSLECKYVLRYDVLQLVGTEWQKLLESLHNNSNYILELVICHQFPANGFLIWLISTHIYIPDFRETKVSHHETKANFIQQLTCYFMGLLLDVYDYVLPGSENFISVLFSATTSNLVVHAKVYSSYIFKIQTNFLLRHNLFLLFSCCTYYFPYGSCYSTISK